MTPGLEPDETDDGGCSISMDRPGNVAMDDVRLAGIHSAWVVGSGLALDSAQARI
jgi:hypothetical protein